MQLKSVKKDYQRAIERTYRGNPLAKLSEMGVSSEQIKHFIIDTLEPYFTDKEFLNRNGTTLFSAEAINVARIKMEPKAESWLRQVLSIYRAACKANKSFCLQSVGYWEDQIVHGKNEFWSGLLMDVDVAALPLEDFKYEVFRSIGMLIEACVQPQLKALLAQIRLLSGEVNPNDGLADRELGKIVDELFSKLPDRELVAPQPWGIRLNQWRNMAQHHKTAVNDGKIRGVYGIGTKQIQVILSRDEVLAFVRKLNLVLGVLRGARNIFLSEHLDDVEPYLPRVPDRDDARVFELAAPLATQGFIIENLAVDSDSVVVRIRDQKGGEPRRRLIHCSQFIQIVWLFFPYEAVTIDFVDFEGFHKARFTARGRDLKDLPPGELGIKGLANIVKFQIPPAV